jgi:hypothetical protein
VGTTDATMALPSCSATWPNAKVLETEGMKYHRPHKEGSPRFRVLRYCSGDSLKPRLESHAMSFIAQWLTCQTQPPSRLTCDVVQCLRWSVNWEFSRFTLLLGFPLFLSNLELKMAAHEDVEFKTLDGLTLRGWLYPASKRGPGIVITPGVSQSQFHGSFYPFHCM